MTKTVCDICGKEMPSSFPVPIVNCKFTISSFGKSWDICSECREELNKWIKRRKEGKEQE